MGRIECFLKSIKRGGKWAYLPLSKSGCIVDLFLCLVVISMRVYKVRTPKSRHYFELQMVA